MFTPKLQTEKQQIFGMYIIAIGCIGPLLSRSNGIESQVSTTDIHRETESQHGGNSELRATSCSLHLFVLRSFPKFCESRLGVTQDSRSTLPQTCIQIHLTTTLSETIGLATTHCTFAAANEGCPCAMPPCAMQGENKALVRIRIRPHSLSSGQSISVTFMFSARWTASLGGHHIVQPRRYRTRYRVRCFMT